MILREHFEQRPIEATYGSFRSLVPLTTPSGSQWTESELETELLEQLAFSPLVYDLITQPIIRYTHSGEPRRYTPDIAVQLHGTSDDLPSRYIIEVKKQQDLARNFEWHAIRFEVGRICADHMGAVFRIMDESRIRTPYLANARLLARYLTTELSEHEYDAVESLRHLRPTTVEGVVEFLGRQGFAEPDARYLVEYVVARRLAQSDLTVAFNDCTLIKPSNQDNRFSARNDAILRLLQEAPDR